ncbi:putative ABC transport system permease protein [Paenibacillus methanolicus]|uniref:Putative ABC transport system permease protein n=2 Tax=Paenibacillus methanolicus TaxID=582686 RepID=A0A5S5BT81_9BACL|nr:putative ABC transport system permease protein [Paenibacillus methanolicus]
MIGLAWSTLRSRKGSFIGSFIAAVLAIALIASCGMLMESALRGNPGANRFAAADLIVTANRQVEITQSDGDTKRKPIAGLPSLPADLAERLKQVPGVAEIVADKSFYAQPLDEMGRVVRGTNGSATMGHEWASARLTPYSLREGKEPKKGEVVLDADLANRSGVSVGQQVSIATEAGVNNYMLSGIAVPSGEEALPTQGAIFFASSDAIRLAGESPTAIGVVAESGAAIKSLSEAVRGVAGDVDLYRSGSRSRADHPAVLVSYAGAISVFAIMGAVSVFAAIFVIAGTTAFSVQQRLRELALLRTIGATPKQLRRMIGAENFWIAVAASLIGCPLGILLAKEISRQFQEIGVVPIQYQLQIGPFPLLTAVVAGLAVTQIAARAAARRGSRIPPTQALRESVADLRGSTPIKIAAGLICIGGAVAVLLFTPLGGSDGTGIGMGFIACFLLLIAASLWGPLLVSTIGRLVGRFLRMFGGVTSELAAANTTARASRMASAAIPLALLVALNGTMLLTSSLLIDLERSEGKKRVSNNVVLTAQGAPGLPFHALSDTSKVSGVADVTAAMPTTVLMRFGDQLKKTKAQGLFSTGSEPVLELGVQSGHLRDLAEGSAAISQELSDKQGWQVGDQIELWLSDGTEVKLKVAGIYALSRGFGDVILPGKLVLENDPLGLLGVLYVRGKSTADTAQLASQLTSLRPKLPQLNVNVPEGSSSVGKDNIRSQQAPSYLLVLILAGFTAIAVVNTFAMATGVRKREFNDLRLAGATSKQIQRMAVWETLIVVLIGLLTGCMITNGVVGAFSIAQDGIWRWVIDPTLYGGLILAAGILGLAAGLIPVRLTVSRLRQQTGRY